MTFNEWLDASREYAQENLDQRHGQALFNHLVYTRPDLSERVRGHSGLDPFHDNKQIPTFVVWLSEHWNDKDQQ